ncbi:unnamed protein product [Prorocentrum cordatum]|uniref:Uncharacterized protein n=1 Tax=Prorocentrum cordatum TaxID=2364126 RepID=A0ABN9Y9K5_9DINO|nr:unnamed protein product [Polarella glacialis]
MSAAFVVEAVDAIMSAALANLDGLEVVERCWLRSATRRRSTRRPSRLLSPARSAFGIAFDLTDQFKSTPRTGVQSQARARLEGYVSTPVKEGQPRSPAGDSSPRLLSEGRAAKLHIENEAKRQAAECARAKEVERARSLSDWLKEKVSHALEKREEVLTGVSQKAKRHAEAVEGKLRRVQEAEEHRREELKAKLEPTEGQARAQPRPREAQRGAGSGQPEGEEARGGRRGHAEEGQGGRGASPRGAEGQARAQDGLECQRQGLCWAAAARGCCTEEVPATRPRRRRGSALASPALRARAAVWLGHHHGGDGAGGVSVER